MLKLSVILCVFNKGKILSSYTYPQVVPNLFEFLSGYVNCLVTNILQIIFFCVQQKKEIHIYIYIYIYAFSRRFYPKRLTLHSSYSFTFDQLLLSLGI